MIVKRKSRQENWQLCLLLPEEKVFLPVYVADPRKLHIMETMIHGLARNADAETVVADSLRKIPVLEKVGDFFVDNSPEL